jgi:protein MBA1
LLTTHEYAKSASRRLRNLHPVGKPAAYKWRLISQPSPVRIVSLRAIEGYLSVQPVRTGNALYVNVLAQFDTIQALTRRGVPSTVEPKRVVEYLLFEKRMWYDTPWVIKEQLYVDR